jgi:hypothetical protein
VTAGGMKAKQFNMAKPKQSKPVKRRSPVRKLLSLAEEEGVMVSPDGKVTRPGSIEALLRRRKQPSLTPVYLTKQIVRTSRIKPSDVVSIRSGTKGRVAVADLPIGPSLEELMREALDRNDPEFIERVAKTMRGVKNREGLRELNKEMTALLWKAAQGPINVAALARELCQPERNLIDQMPRGTKKTERMARLETRREAIDKRLRRYCEQIGLRVARPGRPHGRTNVDK